VVYGRPRTFIALAVGVIAFLLLPGTLRLPTRLVLGWDVFTALYLMIAYIMMLRCDVGHIRRSAVLQDDGRFLRSAPSRASPPSCSSSAPRRATRPG
jgi:uncharacterized membrane protein